MWALKPGCLRPAFFKIKSKIWPTPSALRLSLEFWWRLERSKFSARFWTEFLTDSYSFKESLTESGTGSTFSLLPLPTTLISCGPRYEGEKFWSLILLISDKRSSIFKPKRTIKWSLSGLEGSLECCKFNWQPSSERALGTLPPTFGGLMFLVGLICRKTEPILHVLKLLIVEK